MSVVQLDPRPGQALYLNQVATAYAGLKDPARIVLLDTVNRHGELVAHVFPVPFSVGCSDEDLAVRDAYILAKLNNLFVTFGGARLDIYLPADDARLAEAVRSAVGRFDFDRPGNDRAGLGSFANYMARINRAAGLPPFRPVYHDIAEYVSPPKDKLYRLFDEGRGGEERELLRRAVDSLDGKVFVGLDVGGTGIKAAAVVGGGIAALYSYPWHPATFQYTREIVDPIIAVAKLLAAAATLWRLAPDHPLLGELHRTDEPKALPTLAGRLDAAVDGLGGAVEPLDGLVCGFPDIVIGDKVVGGEVYKLRGIRRRDPAAYDADFAAIMNLDDALRPLCRPDGETVVMNDGFITSFVISAERSYCGTADNGECCQLVHTIGTEMGTGIICAFGADQDIPIEGYNWIVDLSRGEESVLDADDVRSSVNFNTAVPGTIQKVISQSGLIRLAMRNFARNNPARIDELLREGLLAWEERNGVRILVVPSKPHDRRSDLVRRLANLLRDGDESVKDAYREMGLVLGVLIEAMDAMLAGVSHERFVSGGVVADNACFRCFVEGLKAAYPGYEVKRLDGDICSTPLLTKLSHDDIGYMTAVGSCYVAAKRMVARLDLR